MHACHYVIQEKTLSRFTFKHSASQSSRVTFVTIFVRLSANTSAVKPTPPFLKNRNPPHLKIESNFGHFFFYTELNFTHKLHTCSSQFVIAKQL